MTMVHLSAMMLPSIFVVAIFASCSWTSTATQSTSSLPNFPEKKSQRLRKHKEGGVFATLPKSGRRKGSHKNSYDQILEYPPRLSDYYGYNKGTSVPGQPMVDNDYYDEHTEEPEQLYHNPIYPESQYPKKGPKAYSKSKSNKSKGYRGSSKGQSVYKSSKQHVPDFDYGMEIATGEETERTDEPTDSILEEPMNSIVDIAAANDEFSTLVDLLSQANLLGVLEFPGPYTVFAPTDDAFAALGNATLEALAADKKTLENVLLYHVLGGAFPSTDLIDGMRATMLNGDKVSIFLDPLMINDANIIMTDITANNGVIHVLDTVLLPPTQDKPMPSFHPPTEAYFDDYDDDYVILSEPQRGSKSRGRSKSRKNCKSSNGNLRMGKEKVNHAYFDGSTDCNTKSLKSKSKSRKGSTKSKSKDKVTANTFFPTFSQDNESPAPSPSFGNMTSVPSSPGGGSITMRPSLAGGEGTTAAPTTPDVAGGTSLPTNSNEGPTATPTEATSLVEITLDPFALLYVIDKDDIPPTEDYDAASVVTIDYIKEYLSNFYAAPPRVYVSAEIMPGATAYSLISGAIRDYNGTIVLDYSGEIPLPEDVDAVLESAFIEPDLNVLLEKLAAELPPENLFSTATNVRKVDSTTTRPNKSSSSLQQIDKEESSLVQQSLLAVAIVGMVGLSLYGAAVSFRTFRARKQSRKGGFFVGDDIVLGSNYFSGSAYLEDR